MQYSIPTKVCILYGFINFCTSLIHNVFIIYHIQVFVSVFCLSKSSFWAAEIIFLIWNAINDPIFGWLIDKRLLHEFQNNDSISQRRATIISYTGPFMSLAFLATWFPEWLPGYPGIRFLVVLCSYDTAVTLLDLMKGALLADLAVSQYDRSRLGSAASVGQALSASGLVTITWWMGSSSTGSTLEHFNDPNSKLDPGPASREFKILAVILAIFSALGTFFGGRCLARCPNLSRGTRPVSLEAPFESQPCSIDLKSDSTARIPIEGDSENLPAFLFNIIQRPSFLIFNLMQAFQVFHCHFNSIFFPLFAKILLGPYHETLFCAILGISFVLPHVNNVFLLKASETHGTYVVIKGLFWVKIGLGLMLLLRGYDLVSMSIFLACNRVFTEGICKLLSQVISDLVDEDFVLSHRPQPLSALVFGASSLLGRPGQTFAPLVGYSLLSLLTGREMVSEKPLLAEQDVDLRWACFSLAWSVVVAVGLIQLALWSRYKLHGTTLARIKKERLIMTDRPGLSSFRRVISA